MGKGKKVQGTVTEYHNWVIQSLVDRLAPDHGRVVAAIIASWVDKDPEGLLQKHRLDFDTYQQALSGSSPSTQDADSDRGPNVVDYIPRAAGGSR